MKQMIVLVSTIALGIMIAGFVMGFSSEAKSLATDTGTALSYTNVTTP